MLFCNVDTIKCSDLNKWEKIRHTLELFSRFIILCSTLIPGVLVQSRNGMAIHEVLGVKLPFGRFSDWTFWNFGRLDIFESKSLPFCLKSKGHTVPNFERFIAKLRISKGDLEKCKITIEIVFFCFNQGCLAMLGMWTRLVKIGSKC